VLARRSLVLLKLMIQPEPILALRLRDGYDEPAVFRFGFHPCFLITLSGLIAVDDFVLGGCHRARYVRDRIICEDFTNRSWG
jgi:hypothetical protein